MNKFELRIKRLNPRATIPKRAHINDAGLDITAVKNILIYPNETSAVETGLSIAVPNGYYGRIAPRSGLAIKNGIHVFAGVIDSNYRGECNVILFNSSNKIFIINIGDKIAQLIIEKIGFPDVVEVDELDETDRGVNGFGSTDYEANSGEEIQCVSYKTPIAYCYN